MMYLARQGADGAQPVGWDKTSLLRQQDTLKGGIRAGRRLATGETNFYAGDQEITVQMKTALGQLPSASVVLQ
jgi:hypothetical protein